VGLFIITSFDVKKNSPLHYTFFKLIDKGDCNSTKGYKTFIMPNRIDYSLKQKIIQKKKEALVKDDKTEVITNSFVLNETDWIIIYKAFYGKRYCKTGTFMAIRCLKVSDESNIDAVIKKSLEESFVSETYVSHLVLVKEQPNNSKSKASTLDKIVKQTLDFLPETDKKEFKREVRKTSDGVRG